jgi:hypothetical protein
MRNGSNPMQLARSRAPAPQPKVVVLPVLRETIRELPSPPTYSPPSIRQLPAPAPYPQRAMGCLPALLAMIGVGGCGIWWLLGQFV